MLGDAIEQLNKLERSLQEAEGTWRAGNHGADTQTDGPVHESLRVTSVARVLVKLELNLEARTLERAFSHWKDATAVSFMRLHAACTVFMVCRNLVRRKPMQAFMIWKFFMLATMVEADVQRRTSELTTERQETRGVQEQYGLAHARSLISRAISYGKHARMILLGAHFRRWHTTAQRHHTNRRDQTVAARMLGRHLQRFIHGRAVLAFQRWALVARILAAIPAGHEPLPAARAPERWRLTGDTPTGSASTSSPSASPSQLQPTTAPAPLTSSWDMLGFPSLTGTTSGKTIAAASSPAAPSDAVASRHSESGHLRNISDNTGQQDRHFSDSESEYSDISGKTPAHGLDTVRLQSDKGPSPVHVAIGAAECAAGVLGRKRRPVAAEAPLRLAREEVLEKFSMIQFRWKAAAYTKEGMSWKALFKVTDKDNSGDLCFGEFRGFFRRVLKLPPRDASDEFIACVFQTWDVDDSKTITADEVFAGLQMSPHRFFELLTERQQSTVPISASGIKKRPLATPAPAPATSAAPKTAPPAAVTSTAELPASRPLVRQGTISDLPSLIQAKWKAASYTPQGMNWLSLFQSADKDFSGELDFAELHGLMRRVLKIGPADASKAQLYRLFDKWDTDGNGVLSWEEVQNAMMTAPGDAPPPAEAGGEANESEQKHKTQPASSCEFWGETALLCGLAPFLESFENSALTEEAAALAGEAPTPKTQAQCRELLLPHGEEVAAFVERVPYMPPRWQQCTNYETRIWTLLTASLFLTFTPPLDTSQDVFLFLGLDEWRQLVKEILDAAASTDIRVPKSRSNTVKAEIDQVFHQATLEAKKREHDDPMAPLHYCPQSRSPARGTASRDPSPTRLGVPLTPKAAHPPDSPPRSPGGKSKVNLLQDDMSWRNQFTSWTAFRRHAVPASPTRSPDAMSPSNTSCDVSRTPPRPTASPDRTTPVMTFYAFQLGLVGLARWMHVSTEWRADGEDEWQEDSQVSLLTQFVVTRLVPTAKLLQAKRTAMEEHARASKDDLDDPQFRRVLEANKPALLSIFRQYAPDATRKRNAKCLNMKQAWLITRDFGIAPNFCNAKQLKDAFESVLVGRLEHGQAALLVSGAGSGANKALIDFRGFVELMALVALRHCRQLKRGAESSEPMSPVARLALMLSCMECSEGLHKLYANRSSSILKVPKFVLP